MADESEQAPPPPPQQDPPPPPPPPFEPDHNLVGYEHRGDDRRHDTKTARR
jgi:hypothetical protein